MSENSPRAGPAVGHLVSLTAWPSLWAGRQQVQPRLASWLCFSLAVATRLAVKGSCKRFRAAQPHA